MTVKSASFWSGSFVTLDATGAKSTPSVGPSGTLYVDGVANGATVTITGSNPYRWAVTLPTLTAGQRVEIYITATISGVATASFVAAEQADISTLGEIKAAVDSVQTWTAANISSSVTSGKITQIRGDTWDFEIPDLTLDSNLIQIAIKETNLDADAQALLLIDTATGLLYVNGKPATDASLASLSYTGTTLTVTVDASITAQLPTGNHHYGIQSVTAAGVVSESYGGTFTITADTVRATA